MLTSCLGGQYTNVLLVHLHPVWEVSQYTCILSGRSVSTLTSCLGGQSVHISYLGGQSVHLSPVIQHAHILSGK